MPRMPNSPSLSPSLLYVFISAFVSVSLCVLKYVSPAEWQQVQWETKMLQSDVINNASANEAKQAALTALTQSALRPRQAQDQKQITLKIDAKQKSKTNKN